MSKPFIHRVSIKNYKSIGACRVDLQDLTFLVGRNGAGKSNFLDAIKFVADSLSMSLEHALRDRGSVKEVRRRSVGHPHYFAIRLDFEIPQVGAGHYSFRIGSDSEVLDEECVYRPHLLDLTQSSVHSFRTKKGELVSSTTGKPALVKDRLALVNYAGIAEFRPVYDALSRIENYNLNPAEISKLQRADHSEQLRRDGSNAASTLRRMTESEQEVVNRLLGDIVPGIEGVDDKLLGSFETMEFRQRMKGQKEPWRFLASSMSDGTLRSFGILLAALQNLKNGPLMIGLEEPETAVHPAASQTLLHALRHASERRQILVTSHSPDLLDDPDISDESLLSVENFEGETSIGPIDRASREVLREKLFTPGELLRQNQIGIDPASRSQSLADAQLSLFDTKA